MSIAEEMDEFLVEDYKRSKCNMANGVSDKVYPYVPWRESEDLDLRLTLALA